MFKKTLLVLIAAIAAVQSFAQLEKGNRAIFLNGFASFENNTKQRTKTFESTINLGKGYFVANNFAVGPVISVGYQYMRETYTDYYYGYGSSGSSLSFSIPSIGLGPIARYYFPIGKSAIFLQGSVMYEYSKATLKWGISSSSNYQSLLGSFGVGYTYFVNDQIGVEIVPKFEYMKQFRKFGTDFISNQERNRFTLNIGIQWYLKPQSSN